MANTTSGGKEAENSAQAYAAVISGNSPNGANENMPETLPGEIGTPAQRMEVLQMEIRNAIKAGMRVRYGNIEHEGVTCLVIWIEQARLVKGSGTTFEYIGN